MTSLTLLGDTSGPVVLDAPAVSGSTVLTLPTTSGTILTTASTATANSLNAGLGVNQTWQDVSGSRTAGVTYTNSTGKPIMVSIRTTATATDFTITVNGVVTAQVTNIATTRMQMTTIVPNGSTYVVSGYQGGSWAELR